MHKPPGPGLAPRWSVFALPLLIVVIGLAATAVAGWQVERIARAKDEERFVNAVEQTQAAIVARMQGYVAILRAGAGLMAAQDSPGTRQSFRAFADRLDLPLVYPGIQGLGYSAVLPAARGPATDRLLAGLGLAEVRVNPDTPRADVHAIVFLEPMDRRNRAALGYDMYSHPVRRAAMERARDTGRAATSHKVELVQEIDRHKQAGFLIYVPVYRGGDIPATVDARRRDLMGFVYAPFRADDLLNGIFQAQRRPRVHIAVYDGPVRPENLLHTSAPGRSPSQGGRFSAARSLDVAGARWTVVHTSREDFEVGSPRLFVPILVMSGVLTTLLLAGAALWQGRGQLALRTEVAARRSAEASRELLIGELNHRVKNTLSIVQSIAAQTLREAPSLEAAREAFQDRLLALSHTHDLLTRDDWRGAGLIAVVRQELAPHAGGARVEVKGDDVFLPPAIALAIGMALHELVTNAAKYGALSTPEGRVAVAWDVVGPHPGWLRFWWRETGGPPVARPRRRGFGSRLITVGLPRQLRGKVKLEFARDGVRCLIEAPLPRPD